jgi:hypothetical protein
MAVSSGHRLNFFQVTADIHVGDSNDLRETEIDEDRIDS